MNRLQKRLILMLNNNPLRLSKIEINLNFVDDGCGKSYHHLYRTLSLLEKLGYVNKRKVRRQMVFSATKDGVETVMNELKNEVIKKKHDNNNKQEKHLNTFID